MAVTHGGAVLSRSALRQRQGDGALDAVIATVAEACQGVWKHGRRTAAASSAVCFWAMTYLEVRTTHAAASSSMCALALITGTKVCAVSWHTLLCCMSACLRALCASAHVRARVCVLI